MDEADVGAHAGTALKIADKPCTRRPLARYFLGGMS